MIAWHVYPLGFTGAPIRGANDEPGGGPTADAPVPRLRHLIDWLDYAVDLGCDALALGPVFRSVTHGYDTVDYFSIDPRLGTEADFRDLAAAAHTRGMRVLLDGVFNHVSDQHPWYRSALALDPAASALFRWRDGRAEVFEGHGELIALNHANPRVAEEVAAVLRYWLERGADGWRMDAAYAVGPQFWANVLAEVRGDFPQAYFFGEVIHGDYAGFVARSGLDAVTQYELWKAIWSSIANQNFFELSWCLGRHNALMETFAPVTFIGNHDVTRIASEIGVQQVPLALAVLMTVGGSPHVYYGDEVGSLGTKEQRPGGDDAVRPAFPARPKALWDDTAGGPPGPDAPCPDNRWLYDIHRQLIALRRSRPWLDRAHTANLELATTRYRYRTEGVGGWLEVAIDAARQCAQITDETGIVFAYGR